MIKERLEWHSQIADLSNIDPTILSKFSPFVSKKKTPTNFHDLTGEKFERLTVLYRGENYNKWGVTWVCQCSCDKHTIIKVRSGNLVSKNTNSCGCYAIDKSKEICKKYNEYDLSGEYGIGYTYQGEEFYFDLEDYELIHDYCWSIGKKGDVEARVNGKLVKMHRLIMGVVDPKIVVDHIYHNKNGDGRRYDNRKCNLRICKQQLNTCNTKLRSNNTSGVTGVELDKRRNKWVASITYRKKTYYLGSFQHKEDAIMARKYKEKELFKEYQYKEYTKGENI